jgi:N-acetylglucosaminyl-diphospho-decaprenol L-rhamnosyltransferase
MSKVAAIMVNWNGGLMAVESAVSIVNQTVRPALWVVDNASRDGSADAIEAACPEAHIIRNSENLGYAVGNNQALGAVRAADYILLVNNDVQLPDPDSLAHVVGHMDAHPDTHGACGRYEYPDGRFQHNYNQLPTPFDMIVSYGCGRHIPALLNSGWTKRFFAAELDYDRPQRLEQPAFSCVLMRAENARRAGLMDEQFTLFFNDVDYCWRWRELGWDWRYFPDWRVVHHHSKSTAKMGDVRRAEFASSAVRFARKHYSPATAALVSLSIVLEEAWRKYRHRDMPAPLLDIWRGNLFFCYTPPARDETGGG